MKVSIDKGSGFCFGVTRVIELAEEILDSGKELYCLGEIVHNEKEVKRLVDKGMNFIDVSELEKLRDKHVLIRAHGEPPSTYEICNRNNLHILDGTCPIVRSLQKKVRGSYGRNDPAEHQVIIYGKNNHPEVIGLNGQTNNNCLVINNVKQIENISLKKNVSLYSQTTMDSDGYEEIVEKLKTIAAKDKNRDFNFNNTICRHISHRQPGLVDFAKNNEMIIFVAGRNSSNGKILFEICRKENPNCKFISEPAELKQEWFSKVKTVGVTGGTSTPGWLLDEVADKIKGTKPSRRLFSKPA